jgi:hypothetical protein
VPDCVPGQKVEVRTVIVWTEKDLMPVIAALRDVVRHFGDHDARAAGHGFRKLVHRIAPSLR